MHGGDTPQGIASPHYRGKGYSQAIPKYLKDIYEAHHNDPDLLSLHSEIALCNTRIEDLLTQISGRMGDRIDQVSEEDRSTWTEIREEQKNKAQVGRGGPEGGVCRRQGRVQGSPLAETEKSLADEASGPVAQLLPIPRYDSSSPDTDPDADTTDLLGPLRSDIKAARGKALLVETVSAGWGEGKSGAPASDWAAKRLGPTPPAELIQLRQQSFSAMLSACGVPPSLFSPGAPGTSQREGLRRRHMNLVLPLAKLLQDELSEKLEVPISIKLDASARDQVGRSQVVSRLAGAGVDLSTALMAAGITETEN